MRSYWKSTYFFCKKQLLCTDNQWLVVLLKKLISLLSLVISYSGSLIKLKDI